MKNKVVVEVKMEIFKKKQQKKNRVTRVMDMGEKNYCSYNSSLLRRRNFNIQNCRVR